MNPLKYQPTKLNEAQRLLIALGVDDLVVVATKREPNKSFTKKGPGRRPGKAKDHSVDTKPVMQGDVMAPGLFLGQHTNPIKNTRRQIKGSIGARQWKRNVKASRRDGSLAELG
jgi:hypothetical protein